MKKILRFLLSKTGYEIRKINPASQIIDHSLECEVEKSLAVIRPYTMLPRQRLSILFEFVQYISKFKISGDIIECGVWKGAVGMFAVALQYYKDIRNLHMFDAFDDICEPDATVDGERAIREAGGVKNTTGKLEPIKGVYKNLGGHGTVDMQEITY
jgi:hypothetical protein